MATKVSQKPICDSCGADVRDGSLYCYNCGGAVTPESKKAVAARSAAVSDAWFRDDIVAEPRQTTKLSEEIREAAETTDSEEVPAKPKAGIYEEAKLKTAASLRRKGKSIQRRNVEVVWEEPDSGPGARFILSALVLTLLVILIFLAAEYLK